MKEIEISKGKSYAIQILVANELGLTKKGVDYAKMYLGLHGNAQLHPMQYSQLEIAAGEAVNAIRAEKKEDEALQLAQKYLGGYRPD